MQLQKWSGVAPSTWLLPCDLQHRQSDLETAERVVVPVLCDYFRSTGGGVVPQKEGPYVSRQKFMSFA